MNKTEDCLLDTEDCLLDGWSKKFKAEDRLEEKMINVCVCKKCGEEIEITPYNRLMSYFNGYMCYKCHNIVAVLFRGYIIRPSTILKPSWNKSIHSSLIKINENIGFLNTTTDKDEMILRCLNYIACCDNHCFSGIGDKFPNSGIIVDTVRNKYLGYILWTTKDHGGAAIRQLFVVKEEQKKGYGTIIFKWWVENMANKISDIFLAEAPNEIIIKILLKLGYIKESGDQLIGVKCLFIR